MGPDQFCALVQTQQAKVATRRKFRRTGGHLEATPVIRDGQDLEHVQAMGFQDTQREFISQMTFPSEVVYGIKPARQ